MRAKLAHWLLRKVLSGKLELSEKNLLFGLIIERMDAYPLSAILYTDDLGQLILKGEVVDLDKAKQLYMSANDAIDNKAEQLIDLQMLWEATVNGILDGDSPEKLLFFRAAIWWHQQRQRYLRLLAQREGLSSQ